MELTVYRDAAAFDILRGEWNQLLSRAHADCIFYTWEWHSSWWDAYQPGKLMILACRDDEKLLGIAPLFVSACAGGGRSLRIIGCVDVTDYLDLIVDKDHLSKVFAVFADCLLAERDAFDKLDICNIPHDSPTREILPALLRERGFNAIVEQQEVCPVIDLPDEWSAYLARLDKKQRHEIRRKLRRIQGVDQAIDWYIVNGQHNLDDEVQHFVRLMAASDPEKAAFLEDEGNMRFFRKIVPLAHERGWLQLNFLTAGADRIAAYLNFIYGKRVMVYNSGLDSRAYRQLSPGIVLLAYNIRHAIKSGYEVYDFLRGDEAYKYRMGGRDTAVLNIRAT